MRAGPIVGQLAQVNIAFSMLAAPLDAPREFALDVGTERPEFIEDRP